jgi:hypothetical protein
MAGQPPRSGRGDAGSDDDESNQNQSGGCKLLQSLGSDSLQETMAGIVCLQDCGGFAHSHLDFAYAL